VCHLAFFLVRMHSKHKQCWLFCILFFKHPTTMKLSQQTVQSTFDFFLWKGGLKSWRVHKFVISDVFSIDCRLLTIMGQCVHWHILAYFAPSLWNWTEFITGFYVMGYNVFVLKGEFPYIASSSGNCVKRPCQMIMQKKISCQKYAKNILIVQIRDRESCKLIVITPAVD
jgi:hypothetical protein